MRASQPGARERADRNTVMAAMRHAPGEAYDLASPSLQRDHEIALMRLMHGSIAPGMMGDRAFALKAVAKNWRVLGLDGNAYRTDRRLRWPQWEAKDWRY